MEEEFKELLEIIGRNQEIQKETDIRVMDRIIEAAKVKRAVIEILVRCEVLNKISSYGETGFPGLPQSLSSISGNSSIYLNTDSAGLNIPPIRAVYGSTNVSKRSSHE